MICPNCENEIDYVKITHSTESCATVDAYGLITDIIDYELIGGIIVAICPECGYNLTEDIEDGEGFFNTQ